MGRVVAAAIISHEFTPSHDTVAVNLVSGEVPVPGRLDGQGESAVDDFAIGEELSVRNTRGVLAGDGPTFVAVVCLEDAVVNISHPILAKPSLELAVEGRECFDVAVPFDTAVYTFTRDDWWYGWWPRWSGVIPVVSTVIRLLTRKHSVRDVITAVRRESFVVIVHLVLVE